MSGPAPAVARVRLAVRNALQDLPPGTLVLAAVSGGRDSLALADALAFEAPKQALMAGALIVDHGLQADSAKVASATQQVLKALGLAPVEILKVDVDSTSNVEANARDARYQALAAAAARLSAGAVLLGHTLDDQAETVLLGLARGSGAKSLSGMPTERGIYRRPLLEIDRATTSEACAAVDLHPWDDPHNVDTDFQRVKVRLDLLPELEQALGPGVAAALARSATQLRDDDEALEQWAVNVLAEAKDAVADTKVGLNCEVLAAVPAAVRRRVIRAAALGSGVPAGPLRHSQLRDVEALVTSWKGQGEVALPGGVTVGRTCGRLVFTSGQTPLGSAVLSPKEL